MAGFGVASEGYGLGVGSSFPITGERMCMILIYLDMYRRNVEIQALGSSNQAFCASDSVLCVVKFCFGSVLSAVPQCRPCLPKLLGGEDPPY